MCGWMLGACAGVWMDARSLWLVCGWMLGAFSLGDSIQCMFLAPGKARPCTRPRGDHREEEDTVPDLRRNVQALENSSSAARWWCQHHAWEPEHSGKAILNLNGSYWLASMGEGRVKTDRGGSRGTKSREISRRGELVLGILLARRPAIGLA